MHRDSLTALPCYNYKKSLYRSLPKLLVGSCVFMSISNTRGSLVFDAYPFGNIASSNRSFPCPGVFAWTLRSVSVATTCEVRTFHAYTRGIETTLSSRVVSNSQQRRMHKWTFFEQRSCFLVNVDDVEYASIVGVSPKFTGLSDRIDVHGLSVESCDT